MTEQGAIVSLLRHDSRLLTKVQSKKLVAQGAVGILRAAHDVTEEAFCKACLNLSSTDLPQAFLRKKK